MATKKATTPVTAEKKGRKYPYYPAFIGEREKGTMRFGELCRKRWDFHSLGDFVVRDIRGKAGQLSVHATGAAIDIGWSHLGAEGRNRADEAVAWFSKYADELGIVEINAYWQGDFGKGWRCDRHSWRTYTKDDNAGSIHAQWIHVELAPEVLGADGDVEVERRWRSLPKPLKG